MRKIYLVPPLAALVIGGLLVYRLNRPESPVASAPQAAVGRPAPLFQLYDEHSQIVRLSRYVGRHKLLIVFFDGRQGRGASELLQSLQEGYAPLHDTGAILLAISELRPSEHRQLAERDGPFPFPMLSDIFGYEVHKRFGAWDETDKAPREAVFIVDRAGVVQHSHVEPAELGSAEKWAAELAQVK